MTASTEFTSFIKPVEQPVPQPVTKDTRSILDKFKLTGKVTVITGAAGCIGAAIAEGFAQAGGDVVILDIKETNLAKELASKYNVRTKSYGLNLCDEDQVKRVISDIVETFGTIDVFVANAGVAWNRGTILNEDATISEWKRIFDVNVNAVFYCAKYVGEVFKSRGKGSLVMTSSMSAHIVNVPNYQTCYNASKAAVLHMGKSLAVEFADFARVNTVSPGYTNTPLSDPVPTSERAKWWGLTPKGREAEPEELVGAFLYLASDASSFTTGTDIRVDGGYCSV